MKAPVHGWRQLQVTEEAKEREEKYHRESCQICKFSCVEE